MPGGKIVLGDYTFERDDIVRFAAKFDPQPFHLNEAAAAKSHFGALAASGWQTSAAWMRLMVAARQRYDAAQAVPPESGPSPGFTDLRWLKPVYVGDRLTYSMEVVARRATSRPGWGLVTTLNSAVNQWGERVIEFTASVFSKMRG